MLAATPEQPQGEVPPRPVLDVVACDGVDTAPLVIAAHALTAEVRLASSPECWFEQVADPPKGPVAAPADVVAWVGRGERVSLQRWVARAAAAAPHTRVMAVLIEATFDHAMAVVNQGARGLILLPTSSENVASQLREVLDNAIRRQAVRRESAHRRRALATLTPAERGVLDGMLAGMPNKQIAQRLSIGLRTVELRRSKIMKKLNAKSIAQLVKYVCLADSDRA